MKSEFYDLYILLYKPNKPIREQFYRKNMAIRGETHLPAEISFERANSKTTTIMPFCSALLAGSGQKRAAFCPFAPQGCIICILYGVFFFARDPQNRQFLNCFYLPSPNHW